MKAAERALLATTTRRPAAAVRAKGGCLRAPAQRGRQHLAGRHVQHTYPRAAQLAVQVMGVALHAAAASKAWLHRVMRCGVSIPLVPFTVSDKGGNEAGSWLARVQTRRWRYAA